jgi:hypothetical protein
MVILVGEGAKTPSSGRHIYPGIYSEPLFAENYFLIDIISPEEYLPSSIFP